MMSLQRHQILNREVFKKLNLNKGLVSKQEIVMEEVQ